MKPLPRKTACHLAVSLACALAALTGSQSLAQDTAAAPALAIELNSADQQDNACRLTFVAHNGLGADLETAVFETVLFSTDGAVLKLTLFDFQALPTGRPRVRQFDVPGAQCAAIGQVLINSVHKCSGDGIANTDCTAALQTKTRTDIEVMG